MPRKKNTKPSTEAEQAKDLLLWARQQRIAMSQVCVGSVVLTVTMDHGMRHIDTDRKPSEDARKSIVEEYGGALFAPPDPSEADARPQMEPTVEDDD